MIKTCKIIDFDLSQDIKVANLHSIEELSNSFLYEDLYCVGKIMCLLLSTTQKKISICNGTSLLIPYGLDITKNCLELLIALLKENPNKRISITNAMKSPYIVSDDDSIVNFELIKERFISKDKNGNNILTIPLSKDVSIEKHSLSISNCVSVSLMNDVYIIK